MLFALSPIDKHCQPPHCDWLKIIIAHCHLIAIRTATHWRALGHCHAHCCPQWNAVSDWAFGSSTCIWRCVAQARLQDEDGAVDPDGWLGKERWFGVRIGCKQYALGPRHGHSQKTRKAGLSSYSYLNIILKINTRTTAKDLIFSLEFDIFQVNSFIISLLTKKSTRYLQLL